MSACAEERRLAEHREFRANWKHWGPYLSERAWGTVREDYSEHGEAWDYFPHDHARSRAYRWNEDGLAGICDRNQFLCFALALWNGRDPILKERLFGLTGPEGNHGEDVKESYFYLDNTPTHSYMKMLYKYPQAAFPYADLVDENRRRGAHDFEYELLDTGVFDDNRYFDVFVEYAKATTDDILARVRLVNRGPVAAECRVLPTLWFRNTWSWGYPDGPMGDAPGKPRLQGADDGQGVYTIAAYHPTLGRYTLYAEGATDLFFTENETNQERLFGAANSTPFTKDAFHRYLIGGEGSAINPARTGSKAAADYPLRLAAGGETTLRLRLLQGENTAPFDDFDAIFARRQAEADEFYAGVQSAQLTDDARSVQRQALAGMLWSKQLYYYDIPQWLRGDPAGPPPPPARRQRRNHDWEHLNNFDVISMPDAWEYPWYATWDLAFHCIPLAMVDADFAKRQLTLMTRVWYMHPNGALPAYEWAFGDVNPPVHAWAALRVYQMDAKRRGKADRPFLEGVFHKLLLNFTWWVNRKDKDDRNVFQGGFLGLDNISVFDRSAHLPTGGHIDQSDGTAWMGFYSLTMLQIALELAMDNPIYQDIATKFFEHFLRIAHAMADAGGQGHSLWDAEDQFFYDALHLPNNSIAPLRVRSLVGLLPLIAVAVLEPECMEQMPNFARRVQWFIHNRPQLVGHMASIETRGRGERHLAAILTPDRLRAVLRYLLDEEEFLSPYGIRSLSRYHAAHPYSIHVGGRTFAVDYEPAESRSGLFGGNSNWRGPVWFPLNYLIIESLLRFDAFYGDDFTVEMPTGSGHQATLAEVAEELSRRLQRLFLPNEWGERPIYAGQSLLQHDVHWRDYVLFYEYFHGDNGAGLGASHQTGWTGLVADLLQRSAAGG